MIYIVIDQQVPARKQMALSARNETLNGLQSIAEKKAYIAKKMTWGLLKNWLSGFSNGKCWYCEAKTERAVSDVDHFRPKATVTVYRTKLDDHEGYYWLAYDWKNFRYSCQRCNRPEKDEDMVLRGKANEFALVNEAQRKNTPDNNNEEESLIIDPCVESDTTLLAHLLNGCVESSSPVGTLEYERAKYTCDILGLNSFGVPQSKREGWGPINLLIEIAENNVDARGRVVEQIQNQICKNAEYSSFFKASLRTHIDKDWIDLS